MPELRKDPVVDRWVIISPERNQRPSDFPLQPGTHPPKACPFCPGHEAMTPIKRRVILGNAAFIALTPCASRFPFEIWIAPKGHQASFEKACGEAYRELAVVLIALHSAPWCDAYARFYHWHLESMPRLTGVAGFEWGTGFHINATPPEEAACALRGVFGEGND